MAKVSGSVLVTEVLTYLSSLDHVLAWRNNRGKKIPIQADGGRVYRVTFGLGDGSPDIVCCVGPLGRFVGLECKFGSGRQSTDQKCWQRAFESMGGYYGLTRSVGDAREHIRIARSIGKDASSV